jgi:hypothetical protein
MCCRGKSGYAYAPAKYLLPQVELEERPQSLRSRTMSNPEIPHANFTLRWKDADHG